MFLIIDVNGIILIEWFRFLILEGKLIGKGNKVIVIII